MRRQEFREMASIGQGNFSKVFRVKNKFDGMEYALKRSFRAVASELEAKRWQQVRRLLGGTPACMLLTAHHACRGVVQ